MLAMMHPFAPMLFDTTVADVLHTSPLCSLSHEQPSFEEHDDKYILSARAVGVRPQDVTITFEGGVLRLQGETQTAEHIHSVDFTLTLPDDIERVADINSSTASCIDGRIEISFPKRKDDEMTPQVFKVAVNDKIVESDDDAGIERSEPKRYTITLPACGIRAADLEVTAAPRVLKVEGETKRTGAKVKRSFVLPRDAGFENARATHVDGCLTVTMPKKPKLTRHIAVVQAAPPPASTSDVGPQESTWQNDWDSLLDDLLEMGFSDEERNRAALTKHAGSIKLAVRELVAPRKP